ncbi:MAG: NAD(P)/FAD-dependent oxidoreductase [Fimbriimonadaceae bacterium]|nr:NAD(P)/FAD-dependent oxidoreductase [Fimbriimonadaceae bacterium]
MSSHTTKYLLIGGGVASVSAAQTIRDHDKEGSILLVCGENHPPYDRPPVSKSALAKDTFADDDAYSKFDNFYPDNHIDLLVGVRATRLDPAARTATLENGDTVTYEKALLATGAKPHGSDLPGAELPGVFYLRTLDDARNLREVFPRHPDVVVVGAGYLGIEVAAACIGRGLKTTIVSAGGHPWHLFASETTGSFIKTRFEREGARFVLGHHVIGVAGTSRAEAVVTDAGTTSAQCVVICTGAELNTELASAAGLKVATDGGIVVDSKLQTSDPHVWAAGDVAHFDDVVLGKQWHAEHHLHARWQGRAAGANMAGADTPYDQVPYFFSDFLDLHMILRGDSELVGESTFYGSVKDGEFVELYFEGDGTIRKGIAISHDEPKLDPISETLERLIRERKDVREVRAKEFGF